MLTQLVIFGAYAVTNEIALARGVTAFDPAVLLTIGDLSLDRCVPYLPWTVLFYFFVYQAAFWLPVLTYPKTPEGARDLFRLYTGMAVTTGVACVVFVAAPAEMTLRAEIEGAGMPHDLNTWLHRADPPFNTWPSLHVVQSALIALAVSRWRPHWLAWIWLTWTALTITTLTTKQHFVWDALTGWLLAYGYWRWKLRRDFGSK